MSSRVLSLPIDDRWLSKSVLCLRDYNLGKFIKDVIAGITVGLVALPWPWPSAFLRTDAASRHLLGNCAGVLLLILGVTGMGSAVKFIPRPVVIGFTNGIAILIASTQIKDFLRLQLQKVPGEFWLRMKALVAPHPPGPGARRCSRCARWRSCSSAGPSRDAFPGRSSPCSA